MVVLIVALATRGAVPGRPACCCCCCFCCCPYWEREREIARENRTALMYVNDFFLLIYIYYLLTLSMWLSCRSSRTSRSNSLICRRALTQEGFWQPPGPSTGSSWSKSSWLTIGGSGFDALRSASWVIAVWRLRDFSSLLMRCLVMSLWECKCFCKYNAYLLQRNTGHCPPPRRILPVARLLIISRSFEFCNLWMTRKCFDTLTSNFPHIGHSPLFFVLVIPKRKKSKRIIKHHN